MRDRFGVIDRPTRWIVTPSRIANADVISTKPTTIGTGFSPAPGRSRARSRRSSRRDRARDEDERQGREERNQDARDGDADPVRPPPRSCGRRRPCARGMRPSLSVAGGFSDRASDRWIPGRSQVVETNDADGRTVDLSLLRRGQPEGGSLLLALLRELLVDGVGSRAPTATPPRPGVASAFRRCRVRRVPPPTTSGGSSAIVRVGRRRAGGTRRGVRGSIRVRRGLRSRTRSPALHG